MHYSRASSIPMCLKNRRLLLFKYAHAFLIKFKFLKFGYKFGEFSYTRKPYQFPQRDRNKKKNFKR